jgi:DNA repair protein RadC
MTNQSPSVASVPIETDDRGFSRKHFYIEVVKGSNGVIRHYAYNAMNKNQTFINDLFLNSKDRVILHNGDIIHSANTTLIFETI